MNIAYLNLDTKVCREGLYNVQELGWAKAVSRLGHTAVIVYWLNPDDENCFKQKSFGKGITRLYLPYKRKVFHHVIANLDLLMPYNIDLIHIQTDNLLYVPETIAFCKKNQIPYYCYVGVLNSSNPSRIKRLVMDLVSKRNIKPLRTSRVYAKTPTVKAKLLSLGISNVEVVPVGLDIDIIPDETCNGDTITEFPNIPQDKKIVLCIGYLRPAKRPFDVFEAAEYLDGNYAIIYIGDGPLREKFTKKLLSKEEYKKIIHIPTVNNRAIHAYYKIANYLLNFNREEIFGMAILEAMYHNCNVVAVKSAPGPAFIIENNLSGFLVDSIQEMCEVVMQERSIEEGKAKERVLSEFTWDKSVEKMLSYFD